MMPLKMPLPVQMKVQTKKQTIYQIARQLKSTKTTHRIEYLNIITIKKLPDNLEAF